VPVVAIVEGSRGGTLKRDQPIHHIANPITAATIPKKLTAQMAVLQDCLRIRSVRSCRVAAITSETAASTGRTQRRYSTEIDMTLLPRYCGEPEWLPLSQPPFYQHIGSGQYCYENTPASSCRTIPGEKTKTPRAIANERIITRSNRLRSNGFDRADPCPSVLEHLGQIDPGTIRPQSFKIIKLAIFLIEEVDDDAAVIDGNPMAFIVARHR